MKLMSECVDALHPFCLWYLLPLVDVGDTADVLRCVARSLFFLRWYWLKANYEASAPRRSSWQILHLMPLACAQLPYPQSQMDGGRLEACPLIIGPANIHSTCQVSMYYV